MANLGFELQVNKRQAARGRNWMDKGTRNLLSFLLPTSLQTHIPPYSSNRQALLEFFFVLHTYIYPSIYLSIHTSLSFSLSLLLSSLFNSHLISTANHIHLYLIKQSSPSSFTYSHLTTTLTVIPSHSHSIHNEVHYHSSNLCSTPSLFHLS